MRPVSSPLMLFAAGLGTRMGALTADRPKPLIPVAGRPLIDHALSLAETAGVGRIVVNLHYRAAQLRRHLDGRNVLVSDESAALLETGGGLRQALPLLGADPVFTLNSDAVWAGPNPLTLLHAAWDEIRMDGLLLLVPMARATGHKGAGDFVTNAEGRLRRGPGMIYTGAQILCTDRLKNVSIPAFSLNLIWDEMMAEGRLHGLVYPGHWADVGQPDSIPLAEALLRDHHV